MLVKIIKQWCTSYSHVLYSGARLLIEMAPYAERKSSIYQNNKALFLSSPKHCPCLHSHGHKWAYRWVSNQSNILWMSRRNNVKQWHIQETTGFIYICKFLFPSSFVVWMWMTDYQVFHYRDMISKVRRLLLLRGKFLFVTNISFKFQLYDH